MSYRDKLFTGYRILETKNLILMKLDFRIEDMILELLNSQDTQRFQAKHTFTEVDVIKMIVGQEEEILNQTSYKWAIYRKADKEFIGVRYLYCDDDSGWVEVLGDTRKRFWRKGYTKEAYSGIINFLKSLGFIGIKSTVQVPNENAKYLLKSLGFEPVKAYYQNGISFQDYELLLSEFGKSPIWKKLRGLF